MGNAKAKLEESFNVYEDHGDNYEVPVQKHVTEVVAIRLYCDYPGCNKYIKGWLGYNGNFTAETGQRADVRNQSWICPDHINKYETTGS